MKTGDIESYVNSLNNLTSIEIKIEEDEEVVGFRVVKTKETYVFEDEDDLLSQLTEDNIEYLNKEEYHKVKEKLFFKKDLIDNKHSIQNWFARL